MMESMIIQEKVKLTNGDISFKRYSIGNFLGKGGFAKCYQAKQVESQEQYAVKIISKEGLLKSRAKQKLLSQIKIHRSLNHPYIVKFKSVFEDQNNVYIILQLCKGKSLSDMVKKRKYLTCEQARYYIIQLLSAIQYLHSNKIIHRDLKMANIFLSENMELKLGDFGLSAKLEYFEQKKRTMAGTPNYIAPEIIDGTGGHSYQVDLWSTGVICYALLFGRPPFQTSQIKMTYNRIKNCEYYFPSCINVTNSAKDFIKRILILDPKKRMTISQMYQHPFLRQNRPKFIPAIASEQIPKFEENDFVNQQNAFTVPMSQCNEVINSLRLQQKQKLSINVLKSSFNINKLETQKPQSSSLNLKNSNTLKTTRQNDKRENQNLAEQKPLIKKKAYFNLGVTVLSHVDYSTKYGLGYLLSNGYIGVYFNDSTIVATNRKKQKHFYINNPAHTDKIETYNLSNLPTDHNFTKKKMLLNKFQTHLNQDQHASEICQNSQNQNIFVKQWLKTKHAIMFRLSNKLFQVDFFDHSQILLKTDSKQIKFKSKKGQEHYLTLSQALHQKERETELGRRIKYTKQILNSLKKGNKNESEQVESNQQ